MVAWVKAKDSGSVVEVWVVPGASRTAIAGIHGDALKVRVAAPPEHGRANAALVEHVSSSLGVKVTLRSGAGSRRKQLDVPGLSPTEVEARLSM